MVNYHIMNQLYGCAALGDWLVTLISIEMLLMSSQISMQFCKSGKRYIAAVNGQPELRDTSDWLKSCVGIYS